MAEVILLALVHPHSGANSQSIIWTERHCQTSIPIAMHLVILTWPQTTRLCQLHLHLPYLFI